MTQTLDARYYTSNEFYHAETENIFYRSWIYACHKSQVSKINEFLTVKVGKEELFLIRGKDNILRCFYNVCPHRAHRLVSGTGLKPMIVCPYHAWSYYPTGELCNARGSKNVSCFDPQSVSLKEVRVEEFLGFIFLNLDLKAPGLKEQTGDLEQEIRAFVPELNQLVFSHRIPYDIKANWKVVVDNYLECYHCAPTHPDFVNMVDLKTYRSITHKLYSSHIGKISSAKNTAYEFESQKQLTFGAWWLWPNVAFTVFPGPSNITIMNMMPTGPDSTLENFDFFFLNTTPSAEEQKAIDYIAEKLQPEDVALVESVQQGLHSRAYNSGPLMIDDERTELSEHALAHFHALVLESSGLAHRPDKRW